MKSIPRVMLVVAVSSCLLIVSIASAQQRGRGGAFGGAGYNRLTIAANESVQKELGLSGEITGKLNTLSEDYRAAIVKEFQNAGFNFQNFRDLSSDEQQKLIAKIGEVTRKLNDEFYPKLQALVPSDKYARLKQIELQANLRNRGPGALTYADVAAELKLSEDQKKKLDEMQTDFDRRLRELFTGGGGGNQEALAKLREERTAKTMEVLTADQKAALEKLKGAEFDVAQFGFTGRGGKN
jgi:hypothetical protein